MASKSLKLLARRFIFKYADIPATLRSEELQGVTPKRVNIENITEQYNEVVPASVERSVPSNRFEDEEDPKTLRPRDESSLSPRQQKLVYVLDKLRVNDLITNIYRDAMFDRIAADDGDGLIGVAEEIQKFVHELVENQHYFQVTIDSIKKYIDKFLLDK